MSETWWVSSDRLTAVVFIEDGIVVGGAPILRKFVGQPATNLGRWMRSHGSFNCKPLPPLDHS